MSYDFISEMCAMMSESYVIFCYEISNAFHMKYINKS